MQQGSAFTCSHRFARMYGSSRFAYSVLQVGETSLEGAPGQYLTPRLHPLPSEYSQHVNLSSHTTPSRPFCAIHHHPIIVLPPKHRAIAFATEHRTLQSDFRVDAIVGSSTKPWALLRVVLTEAIRWLVLWRIGMSGGDCLLQSSVRSLLRRTLVWRRRGHVASQARVDCALRICCATAGCWGTRRGEIRL